MQEPAASPGDRVDRGVPSDSIEPGEAGAHRDATHDSADRPEGGEQRQRAQQSEGRQEWMAPGE